MSATKFYRVLIDYVRWLEKNNDPNMPYATAKEFSKRFKNLTRTQAGALDRYFGKFLEADHLVEKRFSGHLPSANLDPSEWDSKVVPKNTKAYRQLNKYRTIPFPYVHKVKTAMMKKLIPHGMEGNFTPQEIWDAHAWVFKKLGIEDELDNLKIFFRNAKVKFRIPIKNPLTRKGWEKKAAFKEVLKPKPKKKSEKAKLREKRNQRNLERARQRQAREATKKKKTTDPHANKNRSNTDKNRTTNSSPYKNDNPKATNGSRDNASKRSTTTKKAADEIVEASSKGNKFKIKLSAKYPKTVAVLKIGGGILFDMVLNTIGGIIRAKAKQKAAGIKFKSVLEEEATQKMMEKMLVKAEALKARGDVAYYIQLEIKEIWIGSYDEDGDVNNGLEAPISYKFHNVLGASTFSKRACRLLGFSAPPTAPEGVNYKHQICSYPIMVNTDAVEKFRIEKENRELTKRLNEAWDSCMKIHTAKPAGPITPEEIESAEKKCMKILGGRPIPVN